MYADTDGSDAPVKRTAVERQVNMQILYLFILLIVLSLISTIGNSIRTVSFGRELAECVVDIRRKYLVSGTRRQCTKQRYV